MRVIEVNEGPKIDHSVRNKTWLDIGDEISLNLKTKEADKDVHIDITADAFGALHEGEGLYYVAQIDIPARRYNETETENPDFDPEDESSQRTITTREAIPFSMENVTLSLFALKEGVVNG